jgi:hypothetical protein
MLTNQQADPKQKLRWYRLTPGRLLLHLLVVEGALLLSERWLPKGYAVLITIAAVAVTMVLMLLWFALAFFFRWRFQFSIRSLLVLAVVIAIPCNWFTLKMKQAESQRKVVAILSNMNGRCYYDYETDLPATLVRTSYPTWLRKILEDDFFANVTQFRGTGSFITDSECVFLAELPQLKDIDLNGANITDAGLKHLEGVSNLKIVTLNSTKVTDIGVAKLQKALPNCKIEY